MTLARSRAAYGKGLPENLAERLSADFGQGFDVTNLWKMTQFYRTYPILDALRLELSWTHYRILMRVDDPQAWSFYEVECIKNNWSARELERQKGSLFSSLAKVGLFRDNRAGIQQTGTRFSGKEQV
jgi:hypothetical protein